MARGLLQGRGPAVTLRPTELVHEGYLKLTGAAEIRWEDRAHFLALAAKAMRQILIDHARGKASLKRGGGHKRITITAAVPDRRPGEFEVLVLNDALSKLERKDGRMARVVEFRVFSGMTSRQTAHILGVSKRTVDSDLRLARLWLAREMGSGRPDSGC